MVSFETLMTILAKSDKLKRRGFIISTGDVFEISSRFYHLDYFMNPYTRNRYNLICFTISNNVLYIKIPEKITKSQINVIMDNINNNSLSELVIEFYKDDFPKESVGDISIKLQYDRNNLDKFKQPIDNIDNKIIKILSAFLDGF